MSKKRQRKWTPAEKLKLVLATLESDSQLSEICRREGVAPSLIYKWRKQLMDSAESVFARKKADREDPRIDRMARDNQKMKDVIAEITAENLVLKKTLSD